MSDVKTYSPSDVILSFGGATVRGWNTISVRRNQPSFKDVPGIRGKNARVRIGNTGAVIEVTLSQISDLNNIFAQIVAIDEATGAGRLVLTLKDIMGGEIFSSAEAYIEGYADRMYDSKISDRVWRITCLSSTNGQTAGGAVGSLIEAVSGIFN